MEVKFEIHTKTVSEANRRGSWKGRAFRAKRQRAAALLVTRQNVDPLRCAKCEEYFSRFSCGAMSVGECGCPRCQGYCQCNTMPVRVKLTRIGRKEMDGDNLQGALKAVRDGIADAIEIDDGDKRMTWDYAQEIGKGYSVRVEISA